MTQGGRLTFEADVRDTARAIAADGGYRWGPNLSMGGVHVRESNVPTASLDSLLSGDEPHATFHDARVLSVAIDYTSRTLTARFALCVGDPDAVDERARERGRSGQLMVAGLHVWTIEPPAESGDVMTDGLWLAGDGPLAEASTETARALAQRFAHAPIAWFLYFNDLNAFAYIVAERAAWTWDA